MAEKEIDAPPDPDTGAVRTEDDDSVLMQRTAVRCADPVRTKA